MIDMMSNISLMPPVKRTQKKKRLTTAQIVATIVDRKSDYYGQVAATWGTKWAERCRRDVLLEQYSLGKPVWNRGKVGAYGEHFPELLPIALSLAMDRKLTNVRQGDEYDHFCILSDQGTYFLLNTDVRYAEGGHKVSYHGVFSLVPDPS